MRYNILFNHGWNTYPTGQPVFKAVVLEDGFLFKKGDVIEVMESLNKWFKGKWRVTDSQFISKNKVRLLL